MYVCEHFEKCVTRSQKVKIYR